LSEKWKEAKLIAFGQGKCCVGFVWERGWDCFKGGFGWGLILSNTSKSAHKKDVLRVIPSLYLPPISPHPTGLVNDPLLFYFG